MGKEESSQSRKYIKKATGGQKMKGKSWRIIVASLAVVAAVGCAVLFLPSSQDIGTRWEAGNILSLIRPPFVGAAAGNMHFLDEEAGISAYTNVGQEIDLAKAATGFKTIEYQTSEYIIGSVGLPGLPETEDVHCYVHKDGWVLTYYLRQEAIAKIVDWTDLSTTKLEKGIGKMCDAASVPFVWAKYYDFRYPYAEKLMVIIDYDSFRLRIPGSFSVYERSYSLRSATSYRTRLYIDEVEIASAYREVVYGTLTPTQLRLDVFHTIKISLTGPSYGAAIVLAYKEG